MKSEKTLKAMSVSSLILSIALFIPLVSLAVVPASFVLGHPGFVRGAVPYVPAFVVAAWILSIFFALSSILKTEVGITKKYSTVALVLVVAFTVILFVHFR